MGIKIIIPRARLTTWMLTLETVLVIKVAQEGISQLWVQTSGIRSEETTTKKVSGLRPTQKYKACAKSHSEVERRRRETINEGINELAKIVPNCDKNKGAILQRGVQYITQLRDNEKKNIEKWTLEKMLTDQAISELSMSVDKLKDELSRAQKEAAKWKKGCQDNGRAKHGEAGGGVDSDGDSLMDGK